jgi:hypothetical protein
MGSGVVVPVEVELNDLLIRVAHRFMIHGPAQAYGVAVAITLTARYVVARRGRLSLTSRH